VCLCVCVCVCTHAALSHVMPLVRGGWPSISESSDRKMDTIRYFKEDSVSTSFIVLLAALTFRSR
jgi:hypothetical protein